jgi:O-antigen ligase
VDNALVHTATTGFARHDAFSAARTRSLSERTTRVYPFVAFMFCVMIASFPIELPQRTFRWEVPTITTTLFLMTAFFQPAKCFGRLHAGLVLLAGYVFVFAGSAIAHGWSQSLEISQLFLFLVQALLVAWTTFNLMQDDQLARKALWCFVAACVVRTMLPMLGLSNHSAYVESATGAERVTAFGQDPNYSAMLLSAALLITVGLTHGASRASLRVRIFAWALAGFFAFATVNTGSRGGLLALVAGLVTFAFSRARNPLERLRSTLIVMVSMLALGYFVANSYVMRKRIERTAEEGGAMAGRELLFPALWGMFREKPMTGWGPINNQYEVVQRATELIKRPEQMSKDSHNLYLELLTSTGLVGAVPFFLAMVLCVRAAWRARDGQYGILPLAIMAVFLVANISLNQVVHKPFWMFMAFALAAERRLKTRGRRPAVGPETALSRG